jgi:hypothetical protein
MAPSPVIVMVKIGAFSRRFLACGPGGLIISQPPYPHRYALETAQDPIRLHPDEELPSKQCRLLFREGDALQGLLNQATEV